MASPKLNETIINEILSALQRRVNSGINLLSVGISTRLYSIRALCNEVGISHTTFYRWLRAGAALGGKSGLTQREQLLQAFWIGVEDILGEVKALKSQNVSADRMQHLSHNQRPDISQTPEPIAKESSEVSEWEARTEELTAGIASFDFEAIDSRKNMY